MAPAMRLDQHGLRGMYRFTNEEAEAQFQARMVRWCFWPAVVHLYAAVAIDALSYVSYTGLSSPPWYIWCTVALDMVGVSFLVAIHSLKLGKRHIVPLVSIFAWLEAIRNAAYINFHMQSWTEDSYTCIVPASYSIYVEGPVGKIDVRAQLWDHFATLSLSRATQVSFMFCLPAWIENMLMGLNGWCVVTNLWILVAFVVGVGVNSHISLFIFCIDLAVALCVAVLCLLFGAALERMQRRYFEAERLLQWELEASQMADSVLNHSLKNTLADVAGNIEMFLAGALPSRMLTECIVSLRRGVRSCKERQLYLKLVAGRYQPVLNAINLMDFGRQLLAGRNASSQFLDCTIYADEMLLTLIFDNALSNATKHGHPQNPEVAFSMEEIPADVCHGLDPGKRRFCFQVTNVANPSRPELTPQYTDRLLSGRAEHHQRGSVVPTLSDHIGLSHCVMAAKLGGIILSLSQEDDIVTFAGTFDVEVPAVHSSPANVNTPRAVLTFPAGLNFVILDDSLSQQRLLRFHIEKWCSPAAVTCLGANAEDTDVFLATALLADIVILDQHLDWEHQEQLGSDVVRQLRRLRYRGFICMRSAEDGPGEQALYLQSGANCFVGKDLLGQVMLQQLKAAYEEFLELQAQSPMSPSKETPRCSRMQAAGSPVRQAPHLDVASSSPFALSCTSSDAPLCVDSTLELLS